MFYLGDFMNIRAIMLKREQLYCEHATFDADAIRLDKHTPDIRPEFFRDIDRIIHTPSFTRYTDKTQVFSVNPNDNISKRMTHVQLVSKIARTIGRALSLNEDLIEAIALGHDLGHVPFGHEGEFILDEISRKHGEGCFLHNVQSVRTLMVLEKQNMTIQVLDGILCHNGEFVNDKYQPKKKTVADFLNDYQHCYQDESHAKNLIPMTLEGCVVRISDIIGYLGRDIEDAVKLGIFDINNLPKDITKVIGNNNSDIINNIILDIIKHSLNQPYIRLSNEMYEAIIKLKKFNYQNIYDKAHTKTDLTNWKNMFNNLFDHLLISLKNKDHSQNIYLDFINQMDKDYLENTTDARKAIDYIAGMTDDYFINEYQKIKDLQ